ncbi:MAG TPA: hypothetical protein VHD55_03490 [Candidatus Paceibacterota bacterium]|nr:hypothetical protein [Candidatus Paceibacterota bacterium]
MKAGHEESGKPERILSPEQLYQTLCREFGAQAPVGDMPAFQQDGVWFSINFLDAGSRDVAIKIHDYRTRESVTPESVAEQEHIDAIVAALKADKKEAGMIWFFPANPGSEKLKPVLMVVMGRSGDTIRYDPTADVAALRDRVLGLLLKRRPKCFSHMAAFSDLV